MSEGHIDRRRLLTFGAATALGAWSGFGRVSAEALTDQQPVPTDHDGLLHFTVNIPGLPDASKNIREIGIDELHIDVREMTTGLDVEYRKIKAGSLHFGSATFTSLTSTGSRELRGWWNEATKGRNIRKNIRKNITVTLFTADSKTERVYNLADCFPTSYSAVNFDTSSTVQSETLTVKIGRIEFKT
ncbi:MAG: phage tail protein [Vicinamibacterales bacterium]